MAFAFLGRKERAREVAPGARHDEGEVHPRELSERSGQCLDPLHDTPHSAAPRIPMRAVVIGQEALHRPRAVLGAHRLEGVEGVLCAGNLGVGDAACPGGAQRRHEVARPGGVGE